MTRFSKHLRLNAPQARLRPLEAGAVSIGGAPEGLDALLLVELLDRAQLDGARTAGPAIHVARDDRRAAAMAEALSVLAPEIPVLRYPAWDCLPYDRVSPNPAVVSQRMATLAALADGFAQPAIVLTTVNAASQRVPPREAIRAQSWTARVGGRCDLDELIAYLTRNGYARASTVAEPGDYAVRGGVVDIFPPGSDLPVRLDLFGDVLDRVKRFDPDSQRAVEKAKRVELAPISEALLDEAAIERFRRRYREAFGAAGADDPLYNAVTSGARHQGMEHWLSFFHATGSKRCSTICRARWCRFDHRADEAPDRALGDSCAITMRRGARR